MKIFEIINLSLHLIMFFARAKLNKEAPNVTEKFFFIIKPATGLTRWRQAHLGIDLRRNPRSCINFYFSRFKYKYTYMNNIIYPCRIWL